MRDKAALIVLDDIWSARDIEPFRAESPHSRLLFTTRDASIAAGIGAQLVTAGFLTPEQSREMLARWSGLSADALPPDADDLIRECGGLALALAAIGAMLRGKPPPIGSAFIVFCGTLTLGRSGSSSPTIRIRICCAPYRSASMRSIRRRASVTWSGRSTRRHADSSADPASALGADEFDALRRRKSSCASRSRNAPGMTEASASTIAARLRTGPIPDREALELDPRRDAAVFACRSSAIQRNSHPSWLGVCCRTGTPAVRDFTQAVIRAAPRPWLRPL